MVVHLRDLRSGWSLLASCAAGHQIKWSARPSVGITRLYHGRANATAAENSTVQSRFSVVVMGEGRGLKHHELEWS
ncbi:MAG: hypothetical protein QG608_924 [Actinomycetota bacterium]|nr:hypothetical protein [Actinomycetota bacterium]